MFHFSRLGNDDGSSKLTAPRRVPNCDEGSPLVPLPFHFGASTAKKD